MELSFSPALPQDAPVIFSFARELIETYEDPKEMDLDRALAWTRRKIETGIKQYTRIVLDGETVGFFRFAPCEEGMELDDLYILPPFRGRGIGTRVIAHCIAQNQPIELYVFTENTGALRLYRRMGFELRQQVSRTRCILRREVL